MLISVNNKFQQRMHFKLKIVVELPTNSKSTTEVVHPISFKLMIEVVVLISFKLTIEVEVPKLLKSMIEVGQLTILK